MTSYSELGLDSNLLTPQAKLTYYTPLEVDQMYVSGSFSGLQIKSAAISTSKLQDDAVTSDKLSDGAVGNLSLADACVTTAK